MLDDEPVCPLAGRRDLNELADCIKPEHIVLFHYYLFNESNVKRYCLSGLRAG